MTNMKDVKRDMKLSVKYLASVVLRISIILILLAWVNVGNAIEHEGEVQDSIRGGIWFTAFILLIMEFIFLVVIGSEIERMESENNKNDESNQTNNNIEETSNEG